jgi:hypothetical protein
MAGTATYVYCVVHRAKRPGGFRSSSGVPAASPPKVDAIAPRLWLVNAEVPLSEYEAEEIQRRLQDLEWVSGIALAHESVVERYSRMAGATVIPMKLFTLFSSTDRALESMRGRRDQLESIARRIRSTEEWGLRIARRAGGRVDRPQGPVVSGSAFLAAKKRARDEAQAEVLSAIEAAERAFDTLGRFARETRRQPPPEGATSPPLVNAALLVPSNLKVRFRAAVRREARRCSQAGADLTLTGPWPAYNFVAQE